MQVLGRCHCLLISIQGSGPLIGLPSLPAAAVHCHFIVADHSFGPVACRRFYSPSSLSLGAYF
jgi:hypothetical protein